MHEKSAADYKPCINISSSLQLVNNAVLYRIVCRSR